MKQQLIKGEKAYIQMPVEVKSIDKEMGTLEAIFSTQDVDRHGDVVLQDGWDISMFKKNPVILNSHNYGDAAEVIGKASNVRVEAKKLQGKITFAINENPKAKVIFDLYAGGFLNAFSVGFIPTGFKSNKDGSTDYYTIETAELLEVSAVSVPANARALAKAKGIDIDTLGSEEDDEDKLEKEAEEIKEEAPAEEAKVDEEIKEEVTEAPVIEEKEEDQAVEVPTVEPKQAYNTKVFKAIVSIKEKQTEELRRVSKIINSILTNDVVGTLIEEKTQEQIKKRKINQAIRSLMRAR